MDIAWLGHPYASVRQAKDTGERDLIQPYTPLQRMDRLIHLLGTASAERRADDAMRGRAELQGHVRHARGVEGVEYPIGDTLTDDVHQDWRHEGASRHADAVKEDEFFGPEQWFEERPGRLDVLDLILTAFRRKSVESLERVEIVKRFIFGDGRKPEAIYGAAARYRA